MRIAYFQTSKISSLRILQNSRVGGIVRGWPLPLTSLIQMPDIVISLLDELYIYYKIPNLRWKEFQPGLNKHYMDEYGVSQHASETLTLDSCDKQFDLSSLSTEKLFSAHESLHSLAQNSNTNEDPSKAWTYILLSWLF